MAALATARHITPTVLLTREATRAKTLAAIRAAAKQLKSGDLFWLSYSGHGGQVEDVSGEEDDKLDETWCLFDGQLIDDELFLELCASRRACACSCYRTAATAEASPGPRRRLRRRRVRGPG